MKPIQQFRNTELIRHERNLTQSQKKVNRNTIEGVVANSLIHPEDNIHEIYNTLIISKNLSYPKQIIDNDKKETNSSTLKRLGLVTLGFLGSLSAATFIISAAAKKKATLPTWKTLPEVPRNIALNEETHFATYAMIQNPNRKTILGALGVFTLTATGVIGKNFVDGFKDIWLKKQETQIQRDLQENLIDVETKIFSGKTQIQRTMLSEKAKLFEAYLRPENERAQKIATFRKFINFRQSITKGQREQKQKGQKQNDIIFGGVITALILGLTYLSLKNLQKTAKHYDTYEQKMQEQIKKLIQNCTTTDNSNLDLIKKIMISLQAKDSYIKETLSELPLEQAKKEKYTQEVIQEVEQISQEAAEAIAGKPGWKASFYSHVNDVRGHFYNWLVNFDNSILGYLFGGLATLTAGGYIGKQSVEGIKQAEVMRINAQTELDFQKKLIDVELKNFYQKKTSVINPLINEFLSQIKKGKSKAELKIMAENILLEIKNGPPFIYS